MKALILGSLVTSSAAMSNPMKGKKGTPETATSVSLKLNLDADTLDDIRDAGGIVKFGEDVVIGEDEEVDGPVVVFGGSIEALGKIRGPVISFGRGVILGPKAEIDGPVVSFGGKTVRSPGSKVNGPIVDTPGGPLFSGIAAGLASIVAGTAGIYIIVKASLGVGWVVLALVLGAMFPDPLKRTAKMLGSKPIDSFLIGLMSWPILGIVSLTLLISLVGIPLLPFLAALTAAAYVWGFAALAHWTGDRLAHGRWKNPLVSVIVGMLVLKLLQWVPLVKWFVCLAVCTFGLGATTLSGFGVKELFHRSRSSSLD